MENGICMPPLCLFFYRRGIKFVQKKKQGYEIWADDSGGEVRRERESTTIKPENVDQVRYAITLLYIHTYISIFVCPIFYCDNVYKLRTLFFFMKFRLKL